MADKRKLLAEEKNLLNQIQSRQSELNSLLEQNVEDERAREKSLSIQARLKEKILEGEVEGRKRLAEELRLNRQIESVQSRLLAVQRQSFETEQEFEALLSIESRLLQELTDLEQSRANTTESINKSLNQQANLLEGLAERAIGKVDGLLGRVPVLGDTLSQTFRESTGDLTSQIGKTFVQSGGKAKQFGKLFGGISRGIGAALRVAFGPIGILLAVGAALVAIVQRFAKLDALVQNTRKNLGITRSESAELIKNLEFDTKRREAQLEVIQQINDQLGFTPKITKQTAKEIDVMRRKFKLTVEEAAAITTFNMASGQSLKEFNNELEATLKAENKRNKISVSARSVTAEIAKLSASTRLAFRGQTGELVKQIAATKRIGINMERARDIARGLIDIEGSLEAQFQLEALTGRSLDLGRVRMLAMDARTQGQAVEELVRQLGPLALSTNQVVRDAVSGLGVSFDEVAATAERLGIVGETGQTGTEDALKNVRSVGETTNDILGNILKKVTQIVESPILNIVGGGRRGARFRTESEPNLRTG